MKNVYWIGEADTPKLAIVSRPRGGDWLGDDLLSLKQSGIDVLVSMLIPEEAVELGLKSEEQLSHEIGLEFRNYPIPDRTTPRDHKHFQQFASGLVRDIHRGLRIGIHCRGCIGRSTIMAAAILMEQQMTATEALQAIELARECPVPDTSEQRKWIEDHSTFAR